MDDNLDILTNDGCLVPKGILIFRRENQGKFFLKNNFFKKKKIFKQKMH